MSHQPTDQRKQNNPCQHCGRTDYRWTGECWVGAQLVVRCDHCHPLRMASYYYSFGPTGVELVDRILSAVAHAGKGYHHTDGWNTEGLQDWGPFRGGDYVSWIQNAAGDAAQRLKELESAHAAATARIAELEAERDEARRMAEERSYVLIACAADGSARARAFIRGKNAALSSTAGGQ